MTTETVSIKDIELAAEGLDPQQAAAIYKEQGCLVIRGLMKAYAPDIRRDIMARMEEAIALLDKAVKAEEGWYTPDGTLFLPAPKGFVRDKQVMVTSCRYNTSAALFQSAMDGALLDIAEAVLGPDVELFMSGQCLCKEPAGGHPKMLHQDAAYFEHRYEGPMAVLTYAVDTNIERGALHVVPGSHKLGVLNHVDTESHLGLDLKQWPWEAAVPIEGEAGDAIFFHVKTIHGSKPNYSDVARPVFIHRYRAADDYVVLSGTSASNRGEVEARKENQMGFMVRGFRSYDAGRADAT
ncbi:MAG: phytanoyl-CoA dioxygenase family protein [Lentisphaerae bacterium]|nr:phytanoyl-CoA dioxygenase family protein [Lentisphaerota bacterium]